MRRLTLLPRATVASLLGILVASLAMGHEPAVLGGWGLDAMPVLFAKSWLIGYVILALAMLLGTLAVLIPSRRKAVRKKAN